MYVSPNPPPVAGTINRVGDNHISFYSPTDDKAKGLPWIIVFDNEASGVWGISHTEITGAPWNASEVAARAFGEMVRSWTNVELINGRAPSGWCHLKR